MLRDFTALSFDCYGTLIDWERGILAELTPWLSGRGVSVDPERLLGVFAAAESALQTAEPKLPYRRVLERVHVRIGEALGVPSTEGAAAAFAASVGSWPAFPDTVEALRYLAGHYRLFVLSNVDEISFSATASRLGVDFDGVFTAEAIGSYKPALRNFEYLLHRTEALGIDPGSILHVAQSLHHDIEPARRLGLATCWIDRRGAEGGWGATPPPSSPVEADLRFTSLGELAERHAGER